jgi:organic radical activating enzyme
MTTATEKQLKEKGLHTYSEIFYSFQGEGFYTGFPTTWVRFFSCNLQCDGFGQEDPTDPTTYKLPYKDFDASKIIEVEQLPVFDYGCDSSYTWSKQYKHLMKQKTAGEICDQLTDAFKHESNPEGKFIHPKSNQDIHLAFTGGEPLLKRSQKAIIDVLKTLKERDNLPHHFTVETNGTQSLSEEFVEYFKQEIKPPLLGNKQWFWSVSPKLHSTSGELPKKAIKPNAVHQYMSLCNAGQLKYVVNGTPESWDEVEKCTKLYRDLGVNWDVYIMPVGATKEQQETEQTANIAVEAIKRGYNVSGRLHCSIFGNEIGT